MIDAIGAAAGYVLEGATIGLVFAAGIRLSGWEIWIGRRDR